MSILEGKSQSEIEQAAILWFTCQKAYLEDGEVPQSVFLIGTRELTKEEKEYGQKLADSITSSMIKEWEDKEGDIHQDVPL